MKVKLGDVVIFLGRGITPKYTDDELFCVLNQKCIRNWTVSFDDARFTDTSAKKVTDEKVLRENDILVCSTGQGTLGRVGQFFGNDKPTTVDSHVTIVRADTTKANPVFLGYVLKSSEKQIEDMAEGSTGQTELSRHKLAALEIDLPNLQTQKKIAEILTALDAKIHLNRETNRTLESLATALFQKTFLNNPKKETWATGTLSDLGEIVGGSTPSKGKPEYYTERGIAWITPRDLSRNKDKFVSHGEFDISELGLKNSSARIMPEGTVLFSSRAPIGYIAIANGKVTTNQGFKSIIPKPNIGTPFVYCFLKQNLDEIVNRASGSTFKEVSGTIMKSIPAIIPDDKTLAEFNAQCEPIFAQQKSLEAESQTLTHLRQTLLPKLLSAEIEV